MRVAARSSAAASSAGIAATARVDLCRCDAQVVSGKGQAVEAGGVVEQRGVAAGADIGDDGGDSVTHVFRGLARLSEQGGEGGGKSAAAVVRRIMRSPDEGRPLAGVDPLIGHDPVASSVARGPHYEAVATGLVLRRTLTAMALIGHPIGPARDTIGAWRQGRRDDVPSASGRESRRRRALWDGRTDVFAGSVTSRLRII